MDMTRFWTLPEWVEVDSKWVIECTREALEKLGEWCSKYVGVLAVSALATTGATAVLAQSVPANPEYDRIIAEAQKGGKDPLEVAQEKWRKDEFIMSLDSYINSKNKQTIKTIRNEWQEMDHTNYWKEKKLIESTRLILVSMKALESQKKFGAEQIRDINIMYTNSSSPEVREMIKRDFWQYIKDDKIARL